MSGKVCSFFGHRHSSSGLLPVLIREVETMVTENGVTDFLVGGYGAFDGIVVSAVRKVKQTHPQIRLILVAAYLSALDRDREYNAKTYDDTIYPEGLETVPQRLAIVKRNEWMVRQSDYIIANPGLSSGGAAQAVDFARRRGKRIIILKKIEDLD